MVETKYDLEELLKHQEHIITDTEDCKRDADRCADAWKKLYIPYFSQSEFWKDCDFSKSARKGFFEFEDCSISGDVVFNFGKDKKFKRNLNIFSVCYVVITGIMKHSNIYRNWNIVIS